MPVLGTPVSYPTQDPFFGQNWKAMHESPAAQQDTAQEAALRGTAIEASATLMNSQPSQDLFFGQNWKAVQESPTAQQKAAWEVALCGTAIEASATLMNSLQHLDAVRR